MHLLFDSHMRPVLDAARPQTILEVGVCEGATTIRLLEWCAAHDAHLTSLDPAAWTGDLPEALKAPFADFVFYRGSGKQREAFRPEQVEEIFRRGLQDRWRCLKTTSLAYLEAPGFQGFDAYVLDGDHNFYTLSNELRLIEPKLRQGHVVLFHDVGLKWGRTDSYCDPNTIPDGYLYPEKQGVLSAIEEFLATHDGRKAGTLCVAEAVENTLLDWTVRQQQGRPLTQRLRTSLAVLRGRCLTPYLNKAYNQRLESQLAESGQGRSDGRYRFEILTREHHGLGLLTRVAD